MPKVVFRANVFERPVFIRLSRSQEWSNVSMMLEGREYTSPTKGQGNFKKGKWEILRWGSFLVPQEIDESEKGMG